MYQHLSSFQLASRAAVAAGLAVGAAHFLRLEHPVYALIAAVMVTDLESDQTRKLALPFFIGTVVGCAVGAIISMFLPPSLWVIGAGVLVTVFITHRFSAPAASRVAGYITGVILLDRGDSSWSYALFRMLEAALGIGAAIAVSYVPKLIRVSGDKPNN